MDSFAVFDTVQFEKAKAMLWHSRLGGGVASLLRLVELFGALVVLSWCSTRLPLALRWISGFFAGHVFCFIVFNFIILILLATSSWLSDQSQSGESDLYGEIIKNSADISDSIPEIHGQNAVEAEVSFQDNEIVPAIAASPGEIDGGVAERSADFDFPKDFRRTKSAKYYSERGGRKGAVLQRSETNCRKVVSVGENRSEEEEEMSNEEFQRKIEAFIANQLKFRRQESISGVVGR